MEKIKVLTETKINKVMESEEALELLKEEIGISGNFNLGDTAVLINNAEKYGVYKNIWKNRVTYYIVLSVLNDELAWGYSIYELSKEDK
jgi:hypothetical protein